MADYLVTDTELTGVADAIRTKGGTSVALEWPDGYSQAVAAIPTGITPTGTVNITTNGNHNVAEFAYANVIGIPTQATLSITENGTYDVADYISAIVNVSGGGGSVTTRAVTLSVTVGTLYYTDANMAFQSTGSSLNQEQLPVGSVVAWLYTSGGMKPAIDSGVVLVASYAAGRNTYAAVYRVVA